MSDKKEVYIGDVFAKVKQFFARPKRSVPQPDADTLKWAAEQSKATKPEMPAPGSFYTSADFAAQEESLQRRARLEKMVKEKISGTSVSVNGNSYPGSSVSITNGKVSVNGIDVTPDSKNITIEIVGNVDFLSVDSCEYVKVTGEVGKLDTMSGDVICGNVAGNVKTMSGNVTCDIAMGKIETMSGNIRRT